MACLATFSTYLQESLRTLDEWDHLPRSPLWWSKSRGTLSLNFQEVPWWTGYLCTSISWDSCTSFDSGFCFKLFLYKKPMESGLGTSKHGFRFSSWRLFGKSLLYMRILWSFQFNLILSFPAIRVCIRSPLHYNRFLILFWGMYSGLSVQAALKWPHCLRILYPTCFPAYFFVSLQSI